MHVHWHKYELTIAQLGDFQYFDNYKCRCGSNKVKQGFGWSPHTFDLKDVLGRPIEELLSLHKPLKERRKAR